MYHESIAVPPKNLSISTDPDTIYESHNITIHCTAERVKPVKNLTIWVKMDKSWIPSIRTHIGLNSDGLTYSVTGTIYMVFGR